MQPLHWDEIYLATVTSQEAARLEAPLDAEPGGAMLRFEFLEALLRLASSKYVKSNVAPSMAEGLRLLFVQDFAVSAGSLRGL